MRRILVTGANKGIGLAIVTAILSEHDDTVVLLDWYGEVFSSGSSTWNGDNMGSGNVSAGSFGNAAYFRMPKYMDDSGVGQWPGATFNPEPVDTDCYDVGSMMTGSGAWTRYFYFGGPGDDASACTN